METSNLQRIKEWLKRKQFPSEFTVVKGHTPDSAIIVIQSGFIDHTKSRGKTSSRQMSHLKSLAKQDLNVEIEFQIIADILEAEIESGLSAIVRKKLQNSNIQTFLISSSDRFADVWIDAPPPSGMNTENIASRFNEAIKNYLEHVGLTLNKIYWQGSLIPSFAGILRAIKVLEPATTSDISLYLIDKGFPNVPLNWLKLQLDGLRRHGFINWHNNQYNITYSGLSLLPRSRGRTGSDVERALALAKREWQNSK